MKFVFLMFLKACVSTTEGQKNNVTNELVIITDFKFTQFQMINSKSEVVKSGNFGKNVDSTNIVVKNKDTRFIDAKMYVIPFDISDLPSTFRFFLENDFLDVIVNEEKGDKTFVADVNWDREEDLLSNFIFLKNFKKTFVVITHQHETKENLNHLLMSCIANLNYAENYNDLKSFLEMHLKSLRGLYLTKCNLFKRSHERQFCFNDIFSNFFQMLDNLEKKDQEKDVKQDKENIRNHYITLVQNIKNSINEQIEDINNTLLEWNKGNLPFDIANDGEILLEQRWNMIVETRKKFETALKVDLERGLGLLNEIIENRPKRFDYSHLVLSCDPEV